MLGASVDGLTEEEALRRLAQGRNVLPVQRPPSLAALVRTQLRETMILVLLGAAVLTTAVGDLADTGVIAIVVVLNTSLGVAQQRRAERAVSALAALQSPQARLVRAGATALYPSEEVVPGDVMEVQAGDLVTADGRLLEADGLEVDEAVLTGESAAVRKEVTECPPDAGVADRHCQVHGGTLVTRGRGLVVVTATGPSSEVGRLAGLLASTRSPATPLQLRLARFGRQVAAAVLVLCLVVLVIGLMRGQPLETMVLTAISLAVAAVPESLPAVVTLSLALSAQRMARRSAVVRTLPAVEALGAVTVIATDKTGTLTEGVMAVTETWTPDGALRFEGVGYQPSGQVHGDIDDATPLLTALALCNDARLVEGPDGWYAVGDPMEGALLAAVARAGLSSELLERTWKRVHTVPFDHDRARMTTAHGDTDGRVLLSCKGSPETVLDLVTDDPEVLTAARAALEALTGTGLRVLAVAGGSPPGVPAGREQAEKGLRLLGLVGLQDPPRAAAAGAVAGCRAAGISTVMITGDHPATAAAIARQVGLLQEGELVATGAEVAGLSPEDLARVRVFARTAPEQKLDIVEALRSTGAVVAMTGDGVNDAPALRAADVGVAMGRSGTEVARQAADLVLTDDDFATVVAAVEEGRRVYDNVRRFLLYGLSGGLAEVLLMLSGPFAGLALPLLPAQILWVNLLTHGLPGVALGAEQAETDTLLRRPRDPRQGVLADGLLLGVVLLGILVGAVSLAVGVVAQDQGRPWQSMIFVTLTLQQLAVALVLRSGRRSALKVGLLGNPLLLGAVVLNGLLLWLAVAWSPLRQLLGTSALTGPEAGACLLAALVAPVAVEVVKAVRRSRPAGP